MIRKQEGSDTRSQISITNRSVVSQKSVVSSVTDKPKSMLSNAGKSVLSQLPSGSDKHSTISGSLNNNNQMKIVKRSNFKEYPETGDVRIKNDWNVEKEIQEIVSNAAMRQALTANQAQNDPAFSQNHNPKNPFI